MTYATKSNSESWESGLDLRARVQGFGWGKTRGTGERSDGDEFKVRVI